MHARDCKCFGSTCKGGTSAPWLRPAQQPHACLGGRLMPAAPALLTAVQAKAAAKAAAKATSSASLASEGQKASKKAEQEAKRVGGLLLYGLCCFVHAY